MSGYELLLFLHVVCVIVWVGSGTALGLIAIYGRQSRDQAVLERLAPVGRWLGSRVFGPAALGALAFGLALVADGDWTYEPLWIKLGLAAFAASFLLDVAVRLPLVRRLRRSGRDEQQRLGRLLGVISGLELTVLYLAVADMVAKPTGDDTGTLIVGAAVLACALAPVILAGVRARNRPLEAQHD
jgi:uncharacterized membrane protein